MTNWTVVIKNTLKEAETYIENLDTTTDIAAVVPFLEGTHTKVLIVHK